ncbi:MAG: choice-of-anchor V domain-containing protein [Pseudomonadota bacterium]
MRDFITSLVVLALTWAAPAHAFPDGAPWGSADPDSFSSCASCHFDHEPVGRSPDIMLKGLPEIATPGETYPLDLVFAANGAASAGFVLSASSGTFDADRPDLETRNGEARSIEPAPADAMMQWPLIWRADIDEGAATVVFHAAVNGANGDQSAFGDAVHFRKFEIPVRAPP